MNGKMLVLLAVSIGFELLVSSSALWRYRLPLATLVLAGSSYAHGLMVVTDPGIAAWSLMFIHVFRIINILRIAKGRMHERYLQKVTRRTSRLLAFGTATGAGVVLLEKSQPAWFGHENSLLALAVCQSVVAAVLLATTFRRLSRMTPKVSQEPLPLSQLPTVSVVVPARNETEALGQLLDSLLANDYPKLEILVYDDCSQDATSDVIRSYAQAGVRFLHGKAIHENWVAKNQAYEELSQAASGEWLLYCGADTRLGRQTVSALVQHSLIANKDMISVLPVHKSLRTLDGVLQPLRYWWQVAVPRRLFNRPAALSSCWMIRRSSLKRLGGFRAVSQSVVPETYFARQIALDHDGYSFLRSTGAVDVASYKPFAEQFERALRVRYPEVHRRLELVMLIAAAELLLLIAPFGLVLYALLTGWMVLALVCLLSMVLLSATNMIILTISSQQRLVPAVINFPIICLVEVVLGLASLFAYEFGTIDWKGRNICLPVMHHIPKRPKVKGQSTGVAV